MLAFVEFISQEKCLKCYFSMTVLDCAQVCTPQMPSQILDGKYCYIHLKVPTVHL